MADQSIHGGDHLFTGSVVLGGNVTMPAGTIGNNELEAGAGLATSKLDHRFVIPYSQADGSDVVTATVPIHIARAAGTLKAIEVSCIDAPSGGDKKFTVDLQVGNVSTALASVLSSVIDYVNGTTDLTVLSGTITSSAIADGDTLVLVVTASGSSGAQGQGLLVEVTLDEPFA